MRDYHSAPINDQYAAAHRLGPFVTRRVPAAPLVPSLSGFRWTGEFYERLGPTIEHVSQHPSHDGVGPLLWLWRQIVWFAILLIVLHVLCLGDGR
jgi:hypothetical protein